MTRLKYRSKDPNGLKRGAGYYYLRGGMRVGGFTLPSGKIINGPYYSKYSKKRDTARLSQGWKINKIGIPKKAASEFAHISDGILTKKILRWKQNDWKRVKRVS